ncbi:PAS domain-containing protein [Ditylenchus destructor]|nr:PAS domain-containing protein [Ditylenchus destructor]
MAYCIRLENVPNSVANSEIFALFESIDIEPDEITLKQRRRDSVIFEIDDYSKANLAVQLSEQFVLCGHKIRISYCSSGDLSITNRKATGNVNGYESCETAAESSQTNGHCYNKTLLSQAQQHDIFAKMDISISDILRTQQFNSQKVPQKRKNGSTFIDLHEPQNKQLKVYANGNSSSEIRQIQLNAEFATSIECTLCWTTRGLSGFSQFLEISSNSGDAQNVELTPNIFRYKLKLRPGKRYRARIVLKDSTNRPVATGECTFKSIFSKEEINKLFDMAEKYSGSYMHPYENFYRIKPKRYFDEIYEKDYENRIMRKYLKDENGHVASPINGEIKGLFFSARLINGKLPPTSPMDMHYVTLVLCRKDSAEDRYCEKTLRFLDPRENNFLKITRDNQFCVNMSPRTWVEIYYTEDISLFDACKFAPVEATGRGSSKKQGLKHNKKCKECNLYWLENTTPTKAIEEEKKKSMNVKLSQIPPFINKAPECMSSSVSLDLFLQGLAPNGGNVTAGSRLYLRWKAQLLATTRAAKSSDQLSSLFLFLLLFYRGRCACASPIFIPFTGDPRASYPGPKSFIPPLAIAMTPCLETVSSDENILIAQNYQNPISFYNQSVGSNKKPFGRPQAKAPTVRQRNNTNRIRRKRFRQCLRIIKHMVSANMAMAGQAPQNPLPKHRPSVRLGTVDALEKAVEMNIPLAILFPVGFTVIVPVNLALYDISNHSLLTFFVLTFQWDREERMRVVVCLVLSARFPFTHMGLAGEWGVHIQSALDTESHLAKSCALELNKVEEVATGLEKAMEKSSWTTTSSSASNSLANSPSPLNSMMNPDQCIDRDGRSPSSESPSYRPSPTNAACPTSTAMLIGRRFIGSIVVSLPDGLVLESRPPSENSADSIGHVVRPGDCLLDLLHGKGAQTLLLNAFCGHPKRRMYARLKWNSNSETSSSESIRACEFLCEFSVHRANAAVRLAHIQIFCVRSALFQPPRHVSTNGNAMRQPTFTTRHNASCALIYVDSASIPILGHFPSEVTGKSIFALIHADDVNIVKQAHQQLRETGGKEVVCTPGLRLLTYSGESVYVNSEWAAFVNPWTHQIEMVVSRHTLYAPPSADSMVQAAIDASVTVVGDAEQLREHDSFVHNILSKPVSVSTETKSNVVQNHVDRFRLRADSKSPFENSKQIRLPSIASSPCIDNFGNEPSFVADNTLDLKDGLISSLPSTRSSSFDYSSRKVSSTSLLSCNARGDGTENKAPEISLSYNQINCLENVHRLLKSQAKSKLATISHECLTESNPGMPQTRRNSTDIVDSCNNPSSNSLALTREMLQEHTKKWEEECKDSWKKRLLLKRIAQDSPTNVPSAKVLKQDVDEGRSETTVAAENSKAWTVQMEVRNNAITGTNGRSHVSSNVGNNELPNHSMIGMSSSTELPPTMTILPANGDYSALLSCQNIPGEYVAAALQSQFQHLLLNSSSYLANSSQVLPPSNLLIAMLQQHFNSATAVNMDHPIECHKHSSR